MTRLDFTIEEAGGLLWVAPRDLGGLDPAALGKIWMGEGDVTTTDLIRRSVIMPLSLSQDDGYNVRFVLGGLTDQEDEEWTARARWKLNLECGAVLLSGILTPDIDRELKAVAPAESGGSYWAGCHVTVPPGVYQVEVFGYPPHDLSGGWGMIVDADLFGSHPGIEPEPATDYFRRTRPGEELPGWIGEEPDDAGPFIDFIVRLTPLVEDLSEPELDETDMVAWEFRKPARCPFGIRSDTIEA